MGVRIINQCEVNDCEELGICFAPISVSNKPRKRIWICQYHLDSIFEDFQSVLKEYQNEQ